MVTPLGRTRYLFVPRCSRVSVLPSRWRGWQPRVFLFMSQASMVARQFVVVNRRVIGLFLWGSIRPQLLFGIISIKGCRPMVGTVLSDVCREIASMFLFVSLSLTRRTFYFFHK